MNQEIYNRITGSVDPMSWEDSKAVVRAEYGFIVNLCVCSTVNCAHMKGNYNGHGRIGQIWVPKSRLRKKDYFADYQKSVNWGYGAYRLMVPKEELQKEFLKVNNQVIGSIYIAYSSYDPLADIFFGKEYQMYLVNKAPKTYCNLWKNLLMAHPVKFFKETAFNENSKFCKKIIAQIVAGRMINGVNGLHIRTGGRVGIGTSNSKKRIKKPIYRSPRKYGGTP